MSAMPSGFNCQRNWAGSTAATAAPEARLRTIIATPRSGLQQLLGVLGDHQLFIGWYNPHRHRRRRMRDTRLAFFIGGRIEVDAKPGDHLADASSNRGCVFANAAREYKGIEAAERGRHRADLSRNTIDE